MMKKIFLAGFVATIVFASCSTKKAVDLKTFGIDQVVNLKVGQTYKIFVQENPSTGHLWRTNTTPNCGVSLTDKFEEGKKENEMMVGVPGTKHFDIKANSAGECTVKFELVGPGTNAPVVETKTVKFVVK